MATCVERTADLCTTEGTVVQKTTVFTGEWNTLGHHLVDDVNTVLGKTMHVCFASAEVATLDGVVEQTMDAVTITLVVLCTVDATLCSNRVCATCRVMECEGVNLVSKFRHCCCSRCSSKAGSDNDDFELALVVGVHQLHVLFVRSPLLSHWAGGNLAIELNCVLRKQLICEAHEYCFLRSGDNAGHDGDRE